MNQLEISALKIMTHIGIHAWEQQILQPLFIDITIDTDLTGVNDDINNALDYDSLCNMITEVVSNKSFKLIETVAHTVSTLIKENFSVHGIKVRVCKPHAVADAGNICYAITC